MRFYGVLTALVTPFRDGAVDTASLEWLIERQIEAGIDGVVVNGTTGESPTLTDSEQVRVIEIAVRRSAGRVPVVAGVGTNSTATTVARARAAEKAGADGLLIVNPYYNKPTQAGQIAHFRAVAEEVDRPVCLYNIPGRTGAGLTVDSLAELSRVPNIAAVKEATGDMRFAGELVRACRPGFEVLSGDDFTFLPLLSVGGGGVISAATNLAPERFVRLFQAFRDGDLATARDEHLSFLPLLGALFAETNPVPVKTACAWAGLIATAELRLPLVSLGDAAASRLRREMEAAGIPFAGNAR